MHGVSFRTRRIEEAREIVAGMWRPFFRPDPRANTSPHRRSAPACKARPGFPLSLAFIGYTLAASSRG